MREPRTKPSYWRHNPGALPRGGDLDSTEIRFRRMRAEDHHPR
jgi:hypothetical protein